MEKYMKIKKSSWCVHWFYMVQVNISTVQISCNLQSRDGYFFFFLTANLTSSNCKKSDQFRSILAFYFHIKGVTAQTFLLSLHPVNLSLCKERKNTVEQSRHIWEVKLMAHQQVETLSSHNGSLYSTPACLAIMVQLV